MAENTATTAADVPDQAQQNSPFMKLPTELRVMIYTFAFEDIVDDIESETTNIRQANGDMIKVSMSLSRAKNPIFVGVLGFLHFSRDIREE